MRAIQVIISCELLTKQAMRKKLVYTEVWRACGRVVVKALCCKL
jgi:hypothetical protein